MMVCFVLPFFLKNNNTQYLGVFLQCYLPNTQRSTCCREMKQTCSQMAVDEVCGSDKEANTEAKDKECAGGKIVEGDFRNFAAECSKADVSPPLPSTCVLFLFLFQN